MMDHTASKPGCPLTALPTGGRPPAWMATAQEPVTTPSLDSDLWTNNFHLNPLFCSVLHLTSSMPPPSRRAAKRRVALVLLLSLTPLLKSPQNPNDLGALLHSFSLLGVLSSSNFFLLLAQYECWTGNAFLFHSLNFT